MDSKLIDRRSAPKSREDAIKIARKERESAAYAELAEMNGNWNNWGDKNTFMLGSYRPY